MSVVGVGEDVAGSALVVFWKFVDLKLVLCEARLGESCALQSALGTESSASLTCVLLPAKNQRNKQRASHPLEQAQLDVYAFPDDDGSASNSQKMQRENSLFQRMIIHLE